MEVRPWPPSDGVVSKREESGVVVIPYYDIARGFVHRNRSRFPSRGRHETPKKSRDSDAHVRRSELRQLMAKVLGDLPNEYGPAERARQVVAGPDRLPVRQISARIGGRHLSCASVSRDAGLSRPREPTRRNRGSTNSTGSSLRVLPPRQRLLSLDLRTGGSIDGPRPDCRSSPWRLSPSSTACHSTRLLVATSRSCPARCYGRTSSPARGRRGGKRSHPTGCIGTCSPTGH